MKKPKDKKAEPTAREVYLNNRNAMMEDFEDYLKVVQQQGPSVGGLIAGMNFQQFAAKAVFVLIKEQEDYIEYTKEYSPPYVDLKEEKVILKDMISKAKKVFGKQYKLYKAS